MAIVFRDVTCPPLDEINAVAPAGAIIGLVGEDAAGVRLLLRLAAALNEDRVSDVLRMRVRVYPKRVLLELLPGRTGAELELWSLRKEADYFREVFGRDLFVALE